MLNWASSKRERNTWSFSVDLLTDEGDSSVTGWTGEQLRLVKRAHHRNELDGHEWLIEIGAYEPVELSARH